MSSDVTARGMDFPDVTLVIQVDLPSLHLQFRSACRPCVSGCICRLGRNGQPAATATLQVGLPSAREQYIHRLGRTARAGKLGEGVLVLAPCEEFFVKDEISDLPIERRSVTVDAASVAEVFIFVYFRSCWSVRPSVGPSVRPSIRLSVRPSIRSLIN